MNCEDLVLLLPLKSFVSTTTLIKVKTYVSLSTYTCNVMKNVKFTLVISFSFPNLISFGVNKITLLCNL